MTSEEKRIYEASARLFGNACAICGNPNYAMHHIRYGACGRKTYMGNVIPLCPVHHDMVHSNKKVYQPFLIKLMEDKIEIR